MSDNGETVIELIGVNGDVVTLAGPDAGDAGMWLGEGVKGLFEPATKTVYETPGNYPGARFLSYRMLRRDITCVIRVLDDRSDPWSSRDTRLRKMLAFDRDAYIRVTAPESNPRTLKVRLGDSGVDVDITYDPHMGRVIDVKLLLIAGDPLWYEDDVVYPVTTKKDTRFQPTVFDGVFTFEKLPQENLSILVDPSDGRGGLNPTDQDIYLKWTVPGSQEQIPRITLPIVDMTINIPWDEAPFTQVVLPDFSFPAAMNYDPAQANRRLTLPGLIIGEDSVVDTDPRVEQISAANGAQVWARMNGVRFGNYVPAYTRDCLFPITVSGCAPGQLITLRIPRPWSRPWGLE